jgi:hypothetical protein
MDAIGLALAIVGGVLSFLTCTPTLSPEGVGGATACHAIHAAIAPSGPDASAGAEPPSQEAAPD